MSSNLNSVHQAVDTIFRCLFFSAILVFFYGFLFLILLSQDYALLVSAIGIFAVLSVLMLLTRNIDWYALRKKRKNNAGSKG